MLRVLKSQVVFFLKLLVLLLGGLTMVFVIIKTCKTSQAATLSINPSVGTYAVDSTFEVSIYLNTEAKSVNAVEASLSFPPSLLQLVSPSTGKSIISVWTAQPNFNNQDGRVDFQGGIPNGINVQKGLVTTLTFRVKTVGRGVIKFLDNSKVLLNNGKGTNDLNNTSNGIFEFQLPPPAGPTVVSPSHPDQAVWYKNPNSTFTWYGGEGVDGYSYNLSELAADTPDDTVDSISESVSYKNINDGEHYFHIKAHGAMGWGGTTHYAVKIDREPPAKFSIKTIPSARTSRTQPIFEFGSTDALSGLDYYELKIIPLSESINTQGKQPFFIETTSPYVPQALDYGKYDVVIRAYDQAGNYREVVQRVNIVKAAYKFIQEDGLLINENLFLPWKHALPLMALLLLVFIVVAWLARRWHRKVHSRQEEKALPPELSSQLNELNNYRQKYGKLLSLILIMGVMACSTKIVLAEDGILPPPIITQISESLTNQDIFYVGGTVSAPEMDVVLYLQNEATGEIYQFNLIADKYGEWFYRHSGMLSAGSYIVWAQGKGGEGQITPPGPQKRLEVSAAALQIAGSKISYEFLYLTGLLILVVILFLILFYILFHLRQARKKHRAFLKEVKFAQESVARGFAIIKRELENELALIAAAKEKNKYTRLQEENEKKILEDMKKLEGFVGKEIWELEEIEK